MKNRRLIILGLLLLGAVAQLTSAQRGGFGGPGGGFGGGGFGGGGFGGGGGRGFGTRPGDRGFGGRMPDYNNRDVPVWDSDKNFKYDQFTFVRIIYDSPKSRFEGFSGGGWQTDAPQSDHNLSWRLHQMTSMPVNPFPVQIRLTDPELFKYPFIYMLEVGRLEFSREEIDALRRYLLNGGFLMIDDHWGLNEQANFRSEIARVFPERKLTDLSFDHPIFHCVFDLKEVPQIPGINAWRRTGRSYERIDDPVPHYRTMYDDSGRMMFIECANTDYGDGWESEGLNIDYFHLYSEKQAYPMAINIIFYAMTH